MHILYLGFDGSVRIEAEAGAQLVRLERFAKQIRDCQLTIEATDRGLGRWIYEARLDLITQGNALIPFAHCSNGDPDGAVRSAFDAAERELARRSSVSRV